MDVFRALEEASLARLGDKLLKRIICYCYCGRNAEIAHEEDSDFQHWGLLHAHTVGSVKLRPGTLSRGLKTSFFAIVGPHGRAFMSRRLRFFGAKSCAIVVDFIRFLNFENFVNT